MATQARATAEAVKASELVEVILETEARAGLGGLSVAGGGKEGLFVSDVLAQSPAAKALSLREGDQLLSARVYFENMRYEDAVRLLQCAESCKVSFCLKRTVPRSDALGSPAAGGAEAKGPQAKLAKLSMRSLSPLKKKAGKAPAQDTTLAGSTELLAKTVPGPVDVEFSLPKFAKLRRTRSATERSGAWPSPAVSVPRPTSGAKRRKLTFPRLRVKEVAGRKAPEGRLEVTLPPGSKEMEAGAQVAAPSPKAQKPKDDDKDKGGFKAPQVELDVPIPDLTAPTVAAGLAPPELAAKGEGFHIQLPKFGASSRPAEGVLKVRGPERKLPAEQGAEGPDGELKPGLRLPSVEIAAPAIPAPQLGVSLLSDRGQAEEPEGRPTAGMKLPSLSIGVQPVDIEIPLPTGKVATDREPELAGATLQFPEVDVKIPKLTLLVPGGKPKEEEREIKVPQGGVKVAKAERESPELKVRGPKVKMPSVGLSLRDTKPAAEAEAKGPPADGKGKLPRLKMPSIDISVPSTANLHLPKGKVEPAELAMARRGKAPDGDSAEGPEFKFKVPQVSLPKFDLSGAAGTVESESHGPEPKAPSLEAEVPESLAGKLSLPQLALSVPGMKAVDVELLEAALPKPELELMVEKPRVEMRLPSGRADAKRLEAEEQTAQARLSFPSVKMPVLDIHMPQVGVDLELPKAKPGLEGKLRAEAGQPDRELRPPPDPLSKFGAICQDLQVEIDVPAPLGRNGLPVPQVEAERRGAALEGPDLSGAVEKIPAVGIWLGKEKPEGAGLAGKDTAAPMFPMLGRGLSGPDGKPASQDAKGKLPSIEISTPKIPEVAIETTDLAGPSAPIASSARPPEPDAKSKSPKFSLPKFGLPFSSSKQVAELSVEGEEKPPSGKVELSGLPLSADSSEAQAKLPLVKVTRVDISIPKVDVALALPEGPGDAADGVVAQARAASPDSSLGGPEGKLKMPKFSLPKFGGKSKEEELELEQEPVRREGKDGAKALSGELDGRAKAKLKMPKFKMPSFGIVRKGVEVPGPSVTSLEIDVHGRKEKAATKDLSLDTGSPEEEVKGPFLRMPKLQLSPKAEADVQGARGESHIQGPVLEMKMPQVELPPFGAKGDKAEGEASGRPESPGAKLKLGKVKMPSLEVSAPDQVSSVHMSLPSARAEGETLLRKPAPGVHEADLQGHEGNLKIPKAPSIAISAPKLDLGLSLPKAGAHVLGQQEAGLRTEGEAAFERADTKMKMPEVELPAVLGKDLVELPAQSKDPRAALGTPGGKYATDDAEAALQSLKHRVPRLDLSLPRARLSDGEQPLTEGEMARQELEEAKGRFQLPSVALPAFSTPKGKAPEVGFVAGFSRDPGLALDMPGLHGKVPQVEVSGPKIKLPKFGGSSADDQREADRDSSQTPRVELKPPKLWGSPESPGSTGEGKEARFQMPSVPIGFTVGKGEGGSEAATYGGDSRFKLKMPSLGMSRAGTEGKMDESQMDTQPLCPMAEGTDGSFRLPQLVIPDVGFSMGPGAALLVEGGRANAGRAEEPAGAADWEGDVGGLEAKLKMPKIKLLPLGLSGSRGEERNVTVSLPGRKEPPSGKKALFKVSGLELSTPALQGHVEYQVEGAAGIPGEKEGGSGVSGDSPEAEVRRRSKMKLPKFGLALPKASQAGGEGLSAGGSEAQEAEAKLKMPKVRKAALALARPKGKGAEAASGLLEGIVEVGDGEARVSKVKLKPGIGLSKPRAVNGGLEEEDLEKGSSLRLPKLGFSKAEGPELGFSGLRAAAQLNGAEADPSQESMARPGRVRLPQVELSSPYKAMEMDPELNLHLVRAEEAKEEASVGTFSPLKAAKFKSPKLTLSGSKREEARNVGSLAARAELEKQERDPEAKLEAPKISLGFISKSKGEYNVQRGQEASPRSELDGKEKLPKFKVPKLALSPKAGRGLGGTLDREEGLAGFKVRTPKLGFSTPPEEQTLEGDGGRVTGSAKAKLMQGETAVGRLSAI
ncbi:periaxin isoform X2 [Carettochelys insculpta]|uniref:periaxin isoform X2 n=1 Tax=Carettochelys insculpta TaxID=44489 RepID=UPI003EB8F6C0